MKITFPASVFGALVFCLLTLSGCESPPQVIPPAPLSEGPLSPPVEPIVPSSPVPPPLLETEIPHPPRIVALLPLSGDHAAVGEELAQSLNLATKTVGTSSSEVTILDTQSTPEGAIHALERVNGPIDMILGPLTAEETLAIRPLAWDKGAPVLSFSNQPKVAGDGVFILGYDPLLPVEEVFAYAVARGLKRIAVLIPSDTYGDTIGQFVQTFSLHHPGVSLDLRSYSPDGLDVPEVVATLKDPQPQAIFIPEGKPRLLQILEHLEATFPEKPWPFLLLGSPLWNDPIVLKDERLRGAVFAEYDIQSLIDAFESTFQKTPSRTGLLSAVGRDLATDVIAQSAPSLGEGDYRTLDGGIHFDAQGIAQRKVQILEISPGSPRVL